MRVITEADAAARVTQVDAIDAVREAFRALADGRAQVFPVTSGHGTDPGNRFSAKSGRIDGVALGVKVGTYWPGNTGTGVEAHASTVLLLDDTTGLPCAVVEASHLTALRTAAADAVAVDALARPDATRLAVLGAGHQAAFDTRAIALVRRLDDIVVWSRRSDQAASLARRLADEGLPARQATLEEALDRAHIVATVTASRAPLFDIEQLRPGVHVSAMGADQMGKQEVPADLATRARCIVDSVQQAATIGELQHALGAGLVDADSLVTLGDVLTGKAAGRRHAEEITLFDSSGMAIQDLAVCALALARGDTT